MGIEVISIGSSSSGNSYIVKTSEPGSVILVDVGLAAKRILGALAENGIEPDDVDAVLITHEHTDHVRSVRAISRKCSNAVFCASRGTIANTKNFEYVPEERVRVVRAGDTFSLRGRTNRVKSMKEMTHDPEQTVRCDLSECSEYYNNILISTFPLSHDAAEPVGYTIKEHDDKLAIVTDTGIVTDEIYDAVRDADMLVLESNHDEHLLMFGEYPYDLKLRIKGDYGHLSNDTAGYMLKNILDHRAALRSRQTKQAVISAGPNGSCDLPQRTGTVQPHREKYSIPHIMLAHLSDHNNLPLVASETVRSILVESGFESGRDYTLQIAAKETLTVMK